MNKNDKLPEYEYAKVPTKENLKNEKQEIPATYGYGIRHIQLFILTLCITSSFIARGHLGVTIVAMTSHKDDVVANNISEVISYDRNITDNITENNLTINELMDTNNNETINKVETVKIMKFDWPKSTQEIVLGSFFLGYCIMTFPTGLLTQRFGGKVPMQIALLVNGLVSLITPWLTYWGSWKAVTACRIIQGLAQAGVFPSVQTLLAKWVAPHERATFASYVYTGVTAGTVISFQLSGFLSASQWGWPSTFWVVGALSLVCCGMFTMFGAASPADHKTISDEEKRYIIGDGNEENVKRPSAPLKKMITSVPVWANFITHMGSGVVFVFFFTQMPSYIHYILGVNVRSSGLLSSLPYIVSVVTGIGFGVGSDFLTNKNIISKKNSRRITNSISQLAMGICLVSASYTSSAAIAVTCLVIAMGCHPGIHTGWMVNHIDLAPNFTAALVAVGNTMLNFLNVMLPILVSHVITDVANVIQWRIMFFVVAGVAFSTNAIFVIFMSVEKQPWNDVEITDSTAKGQESVEEGKQ